MAVFSVVISVNINVCNPAIFFISVMLLHNHVCNEYTYRYASTRNIFLIYDQFFTDHVGCLRKRGVANVDNYPKGSWFCNERCKKVFHNCLPFSIWHYFTNLKIMVSECTNIHLIWILFSLKIWLTFSSCSSVTFSFFMNC